MPLNRLNTKNIERVVDVSIDPEGPNNSEYEEKIALLEKHIRKQKNHHGKKHVDN
jgi:hypothetical protein